MNQTRFEQLYEQQWLEFGELLDSLEKGKRKKAETEPDAGAFPARYRRICNQYGLARSRHYSPALVDRLHSLVLRGHHQLYKRKSSFFWHGLLFIAREFPRTIRENYKLFWLAFLLFYGPAIAVGVAAYNDPVFIYTIMDEGQVNSMESMYDPDNRQMGRDAARDAETDFTMFGYYIMNNISIGFRTFAGGILFGVGSVFFLLFNGIMIGGVAGHLSHPPYLYTFWQFVAGHGAFELTAIVICGAAGLLLGRSLIIPGRLSRLDSLRRHAPIALKLVIGGALLLVCAAFIEAFWSSARLDPTLKFSVAACNWIAVIAYLLFAGRTSHGHK